MMMDMESTNDLDGLATDKRYISDIIKVKLIPEKKGTFLKHTEYEIKSEKHNSKVERRYNDFVKLQNLFLAKYPNRMVPRLPPKQIMMDAFLEDRRVGLQRWLRLVSHHPLMSSDEILKSFLTDQSPEHHNGMQEIFDRDPDEFLHLSSRQKLPQGQSENLLMNRDLMRTMLSHVTKLKRLIEQQAKRNLCQSRDFSELSRVLNSIKRDTDDDNFEDFSNSFLEVSKESEIASTNQLSAVTERFEMVIEVLTAHSDMCDRVEKSFNRTTHEKQLSDIETMNRRKAFGKFCVSEETKFAQKYMKLIPSILLQFSNEEAKGLTKITEVFCKIVQLESDKLN